MADDPEFTLSLNTGVPGVAAPATPSVVDTLTLPPVVPTTPAVLALPPVAVSTPVPSVSLPAPVATADLKLGLTPGTSVVPVSPLPPLLPTDQQALFSASAPAFGVDQVVPPASDPANAALLSEKARLQFPGYAEITSKIQTYQE